MARIFQLVSHFEETHIPVLTHGLPQINLPIFLGFSLWDTWCCKKIPKLLAHKSYWSLYREQPPDCCAQFRTLIYFEELTVNLQH